MVLISTSVCDSSASRIAEWLEKALHDALSQGLLCGMVVAPSDANVSTDTIVL
jgi:hypothetical protein